MPGLAQNLSFILLGEDRSASKTMGKAADTAEVVSGRIGGAFSRAGSVLQGEFGDVLEAAGAGIEKLGSKASNLTDTLMVAGGIATAAGIGLQALGSGEKQASDQLDQAIKNAGDSVSEYSGRIDEAVRHNEDLDFAATDTKAAIEKLTDATGSTSKALKDMDVVADLAASKHISLADAANLVGKILNGAGGKTLTAYGIKMDGVGTKTQQGQRALEELSKKLDGQAKASVNNFGAQVDILRTKIGDWVGEVAGPVGQVLTGIGPLFTIAGVALDIYRTRKEAATAAEIANAAATTVATAATEAETGAMVGLDAAMDANPIGIVAGGLAILAGIAGGIALGTTKDLTKATQDFSQALDQSNGMIDKNIEKTATKALLDNGSLAAAQKLGISGALVLQATLGSATAQAELNKQLDATREKQAAWTDVNAGGVRNANNLTKSQRDALDATKTLTSGIDDQSTALQNAQNQYQLSHQALDGLGAKALITADQFQALTNKIKGIPSLHVSTATGAVTFSDARDTSVSVKGKGAKGGLTPSGGTYLVGEDGPEIAELPGQTRIYPTGSGPEGASSPTFQFNVSGFVGSNDQLSKALFTQFINGLKGGNVSAIEMRRALGLS